MTLRKFLAKLKTEALRDLLSVARLTEKSSYISAKIQFNIVLMETSSVEHRRRYMLKTYFIVCPENATLSIDRQLIMACRINFLIALQVMYLLCLYIFVTSIFSICFKFITNDVLIKDLLATGTGSNHFKKSVRLLVTVLRAFVL